MFKSNLPNNVSFIETIAFYGDGGKRVYSRVYWKEAIINLLISIVGAIIFIVFILLPIMYG